MKLVKFAKYYAVITQGILMMVILSVGGFFLGRWINSSSYLLAGFLCSLGIIFGLILTVKLTYDVGGEENREDT